MTEQIPLADRPLSRPAVQRLPPEHPGRARILAAHAEAMENGESMYVDPETGLSVLTASWLADRGTCCGRGCRHCPYVVDGDGPGPGTQPRP